MVVIHPRSGGNIKHFLSSFVAKNNLLMICCSLKACFAGRLDAFLQGAKAMPLGCSTGPHAVVLSVASQDGMRL